MFKKEISIDNDNETLNEEKHKKKLSSVKPPLKTKKVLRNSFRSSKNVMNLSKKLNKPNIIFENKNIVINDITKNYDTNTNKTIHEKKKLSIIHKISNDINSINNTKYKFGVINTETKTKNISKNSINTSLKDKNNLNSENKSEIKNTNNKTTTSFKFIPNKLKQNSPINRKILENMDKKRNNKKNIIQNKMKKFSFGDSYEFNFTFNNYNSNYTYNNSNIDDNILKDEKKKSNKIIINSIAKENIINNFKSINPSSVKNNILGGLKKILNKNKNVDNKVIKSKILSRNAKLKKSTNKDKNYYAIIIQKIYRGYKSRKNYILKKKSRPIYRRKKILGNNRVSLNSNINNTENNLLRNSLLMRKNRLNYSKNLENNETLDNENRIQEIIIDKNKILNVLNPASSKSNKSNNIKEIHINNNFSFKPNLRNRKYKLIKYFNYWKTYSMKKTILHKLIEYIKFEKNSNKNNIMEININAKKHKRSNNGFGFYRRRILNNNI